MKTNTPTTDNFFGDDLDVEHLSPNDYRALERFQAMVEQDNCDEYVGW